MCMNMPKIIKEEKRQLLNFLLQNLKLKNRKLLFKLKTPFDTVLQASKCSEMLLSPKLIVILENKEYMKTAKERLKNIKGTYRNLGLVDDARTCFSLQS